MKLKRTKTFLTTMPGASVVHRRTLLHYTDGSCYEACSILPEGERQTLIGIHRQYIQERGLSDFQLPFFKWLARTRGEAVTQWSIYDFSEMLS